MVFPLKYIHNVVVPTYRKHWANQPWNYYHLFDHDILTYVTDTFCPFCGMLGSAESEDPS